MEREVGLAPTVHAGRGLPLVLPLTVFVADSRPLELDGMLHALSHVALISVLGAAANEANALEDLRRLTPAVAAVAHRSPGLAADSLLASLAEERIPTRVIVLVEQLGRRMGFANELLRAGAAACLQVGISPHQFVGAIIACGAFPGLVLPLHLPIHPRSALHEPLDPPSETGLLSRREIQVLQLVANDSSANAIAATLVVSTTTVRTHLARIYNKLAVSSAAGAVAEGMRRGAIH